MPRGNTVQDPWLDRWIPPAFEHLRVYPGLLVRLDPLGALDHDPAAGWIRGKAPLKSPGPDRQSIDEVRKHFDELLPKLQRELLEEDYQPGMIRRVWLPKSGGGQRGLGIPNVVDRIVGQAVHQVLSPHYEPTFHESSHGFREGRSCHTAIAEAKG